MRRRTIWELLEAEDNKGELTKKEKKRLMDFKVRKARIEVIPQHPCERCSCLIPKPTRFCSTDCKDKCKEEEK